MRQQQSFLQKETLIPSSSNYFFILSLYLIFLCSLSCSFSCNKAEKEPVQIYAAASLSPWLKNKSATLKTPTQIEIMGSMVAIAKAGITPPDLLLVADATLLASLNKKDYPIQKTFGHNELVFSFSDKDILKQAGSLMDALKNTDLILGYADPKAAPLGKYTQALIEHIHPKSLSRLQTQRYRHPNAAALLAPLELGEIDMAFIYQSDAQRLGLPFFAIDAPKKLTSLKYGFAIYKDAATDTRIYVDALVNAFDKNKHPIKELDESTTRRW